jgi:hypothetical protein
MGTSTLAKVTERRTSVASPKIKGMTRAGKRKAYHAANLKCWRRGTQNEVAAQLADAEYKS